MELLIPGLILVALMVYVSTRIKKSAAKAYEAEQIDTDDYSITKPEGLLTPIDDGSPYAFQAYSKDFGPPPNERLRQITAELRILDGVEPASIVGELKESADKIVSENSNDGTSILETSEVVEETEVDAFYKIIKKHGRVFSLRIQSVKEPSEDDRRRIERMLESFRAK
jgi:hypothetical protein